MSYKHQIALNKPKSWTVGQCFMVKDSSKPMATPKIIRVSLINIIGWVHIQWCLSAILLMTRPTQPVFWTCSLRSNERIRYGSVCLILVRVQIGYYSCSCQPWYAGQQCERYCNRTLDVVIVLDMSNGMATSARMIDLTRGIINGLPIGPSMVRVAFVTYSDTVTINFNFSTFSTRDAVR